MINRESRTARRIAALTLLACLAAPAAAQTFPAKGKSIHIIGPLAAGGPTDIVTRVIADKMTAALGVPVVSEPKPGAGGQIAYDTVARAAPDGYTLLMGTSSIPMLPLNNQGFTGNIMKDLVPLTHYFTGATVFFVGANVPAKTIQEFLAYAKANPGKMNYAGAAVSDVYAAELLKLTAGFKAESIRYKGNAPGITAIISGEAHYTFASLGVVRGHIESGRGRLLATSGLKRTAANPELPTLAETIAPGFDYLYWTALFAPASTPQPILAIISDASSKAIRDPDVRKRIFEMGYEAAGGGGEDVTKLLVADYAKWKRVKEETGIKAED
jgi:tripartite-type tricarboxylate transporter receptor subunit TctC